MHTTICMHVPTQGCPYTWCARGKGRNGCYALGETPARSHGKRPPGCCEKVDGLDVSGAPKRAGRRCAEAPGSNRSRPPQAQRRCAPSPPPRAQGRPPPPPNMLQSSIGHATVACELGGMQECSFDHARRSQDTAPETRVECGLPCAFPTRERTRVLGREWASSAHAAKKRRAIHPKASPKRSAMVLCNIRLDTHANNMRPHNPYLGGMGDRPTNSIGGVTSALRQCCLWLCQVRGAKGGRERTPLSP